VRGEVSLINLESTEYNRKKKKKGRGKQRIKEIERKKEMTKEITGQRE
jgi:hypothetical protein